MPDIFFHMSTAGTSIKATSRSTSASSSPTRTKVLRIIYFVPGNPGLIDYYGPFLQGLVEANDRRMRDGITAGSKAKGGGDDGEDVITVVAGASLGGFETGLVSKSKSVTGRSGFERRDAEAEADSKAEDKSQSKSQRTLNQKDVKDPECDVYNDDPRHTGDGGGEYGDQLRDLELYPSPFVQKDVYDLTDQIELTYIRLARLVERLHQRLSRSGDGGDGAITMDTEIILMGHSVGAYIALEVVRRRHEDWIAMLNSRSDVTSEATLTDTASTIHLSGEIPGGKSDSASVPSSDLAARHMNLKTGQTCPWSIKATMLLTPTIQNIALSPSGRIATPLLSNITFLPALTQIGASSLTAIMPVSLLKYLVRNVTGMRNENMVDVTVDFLRTQGAVKQALYLASHEMVQIGDETWTEAVWGAVAPDIQVVKQDEVSSSRSHHWIPPLHHFLFAKEDHWIASETREAIIESIGGRSKVLVDDGEMKLVHAWCLEQSKLVLGLVDSWIAEIVKDKVHTIST